MVDCYCRSCHGHRWHMIAPMQYAYVPCLCCTVCGVNVSCKPLYVYINTLYVLSCVYWMTPLGIISSNETHNFAVALFVPNTLNENDPFFDFVEHFIYVSVLFICKWCSWIPWQQCIRPGACHHTQYMPARRANAVVHASFIPFYTADTNLLFFGTPVF